MKIKEELLNGLTEEQIAKAIECKNEKELLELAKNEKIELTDEQLRAVNGGCNPDDNSNSNVKCSNCGSKNVKSNYSVYSPSYVCKDCGYEWAELYCE